MRIREVQTTYRYLNVDASERNLSDPEKVSALMCEITPDSDVEHFVVFNLNAKNNIMGFHLVSKGTADHAIVHVRDVYKTAILEGAAKIVVAHNHPSEQLSPSREDISLTKRLSDAGGIIGIPLLDHVIVNTRTSEYMSFKEKGHM